MDLFFSLIALELFVGGGGRLVELGPLTLRMILFAIAIVASFLFVLTGKIRGGGFALSIFLLAGFVVSHLPAVLMGWFKGMPVAPIFTDLSPMLYWFAAPFFAVALQRVEMAYRVAILIRVAGCFMAVVYIITISLLALNIIEFGSFYESLSLTGEFFFRGENMFFYKGFLYIALGIVFLIALEGRCRSALLVISIIALALALTRGLILATTIAVLPMLWMTGRRRAVVVAAGCAMIVVIAVWFYLPSFSKVDLLAQRAISNAIRINDISYMLDNVDAETILVGTGFGTLINGRLNIENSYLMILWKIGPLALMFWLTPLALSVLYYRRISVDSVHHRLASAFCFGVVLIYVQTATNPYLNNPIGLSFVLIALFSLRALANEAPSSVSRQLRRMQLHGD